MLLRLRLVCQEPGLRAIGLSSGIPESNRGLGSMSRYPAHILIRFITYIFQFSIPLYLCGWESYRTATCTEPSAIVHCNQSEADNQISQHALLRYSSLKTLSGSYAKELVKSIDRSGEICISGKSSVDVSSGWRVLLHTCEKFYCISSQNLD